eukprot:8995073-Pyramimonas_sp.AAC.1
MVELPAVRSASRRRYQEPVQADTRTRRCSLLPAGRARHRLPRGLLPASLGASGKVHPVGQNGQRDAQADQQYAACHTDVPHTVDRH